MVLKKKKVEVFFRGKKVVFTNFKMVGGRQGVGEEEIVYGDRTAQDLPGAGNVCFSFSHWWLLLKI